MGCKQSDHCFSKEYMNSMHCQCHHKKRSCNCKQNINTEMKRDCMKIDWVVPAGKTQPVFQNGGFSQIIGSGYVSYDLGNSPFIIVRFYLNGVLQGAEIPVFYDSSVAFTYTKFNQVTVTCPIVSPVDQGNHCYDQCAGELSIITRYPIL